MLKTLRGRFILSHTLPMLAIIFFIGFALLYVLETQVLLHNLSEEVRGEALLAAELTKPRSDIWQDTAAREELITRIHEQLGLRVMLLDARGNLLSSSDPADQGRLGQSLAIEGLTLAMAGQPSTHTTWSPHLHAEVVDVIVPVTGPDGRVMGAVRLTQQLSDVYDQFLRLRYLVGALMFCGILLSAVLGWIVATHMERPLGRVTKAIQRLAEGQAQELLPEEGPKELALLAHSVNTLVERLHILEKARTQLLSNLIHELGRPLGALSSASQALLGGADQDLILRRDLLLGIDGELARLRRLLDDLAGLQNQIVGNLELNCKQVPLAEWLPQTLAPWREAARAKGLNWQEPLPADLPALTIDPDRLGQALGNLLSNAIKYTPSGGTITVTAGQAEMAWIRVADTGMGITPQEREHLFSPFWRGQTGKRFPQGMGLGLAIARELVTAHKGRLDVESTPGRGSAFTIQLPLTRPPC